MAYTLEKLVDLLRRRLKDEEYDEDTLIDFINAAQDEILGETKYSFMEGLDCYDADPKGSVSLPFDYAATIEILAETDKKYTRPLEYLPPQEYLKTDRARRYFVWTVIGRDLYYCLPVEKDQDTGCIDTYKLKHLYLKKQKKMVKDTDKATIPDDYIEALVLGALARAEQQRDNFDYAQIYKNQQDDLLVNMKLRYGPKNLNVDNRARLAFRQWGDYC